MLYLSDMRRLMKSPKNYAIPASSQGDGASVPVFNGNTPVLNTPNYR